MLCNIDRTDRINRIVFGSLFLLGILMSWSKTALAILGLIMIIEGVVGWCGIPIVTNKLRSLLLFNKEQRK